MRLLIFLIAMIVGVVIGFVNAQAFGLAGLLLTIPESFVLGHAAGQFAADYA